MKQLPTLSEVQRAQLALVAAIALAAFAGWFIATDGIERFRPSRVEQQLQGDVGQPAPNFTAERLDGGNLQLADLKGRVVLVNFWATWCVPCRTEMPEIEGAYRTYKDRGFDVVAVDVQEGPDQVKGYLTELGLTLPIALDRDMSVSRQFLVRALPASFLIDREGVVRFLRVGAVTRSMLDEELGKLGV